MNTPSIALIILAALSLAACHKQSAPIQADMDAESRQKAVEVREAADKETAALKEAAALKAAADKEAAAREALAHPPSAPDPAPAK